MTIYSQTELNMNRIACGISEGYLKMICSFASLGVEFSCRDVDNLGIDGNFRKIKRVPKTDGDGFREIKEGNTIEFQLKSCYGGESVFKTNHSSIKYKIGTDFFDKLELNEDKVVLIILRLPPAENFEKWLEIKEDYTKLQKCAYFKQVFYSDKSNWIEISKSRLLNPENLIRLFAKPKPAK